MKSIFGGPIPSTAEIKELARALRRFKVQGRGRPRVDVPEMTAAELQDIPRSQMSKEQRAHLAKVKKLGRQSSKNEDKRAIVVLVAQLRREGYTLTFNDYEIGSAFTRAAELLCGRPHAHSATAIRNIWVRYRHLLLE